MKFRKAIAATILLISIIPACFTQKAKPSVEFYRTESSTKDSEMLKLTEDLLYSYLTDMDKYTIVDKRPLSYSDSQDAGNGEGYIFTSAIEEKGSAWEFTVKLYSKKSGVSQTLTKTYENYYRILLETRTLLNSLFDTLFVKEKLAITEETPAGQRGTKAYQAVPIAAPEILSGNWKGEEYIEKIVILRGGRGFIIYSNGASMNISIKIEDGVLIATQTGKSNSLFYPNLPREAALVAAEMAPPMTWRLQLSSDSGVLYGEKTTVVPVYQGDTFVSLKQAVVPVVWNRQ